MPQDTVHIFGFEMSKAVFDVVVLLSATLLGTIIGGLTAYLIARSSDNRKWRREQALREQENRSKKIEATLEWLLTIYTELKRIETIKVSLKENIISEAHFYKTYRNTLSRISRHPLPPGAAIHFLPGAIEPIVDLISTSQKLQSNQSFNGPNKEREYVEWAESVYNEDRFPERVRNLYDDLIKAHDETTKMEIK